MGTIRDQVAVLGSFCICLVSFTQIIGTTFIWGNIGVYVTSYLRQFDPSITMEDTFVILPILIVAKAPVTYIDRVAIIGTSFCVGGIFLSSFCTGFWSFLFCYACLFGLGAGFMYTSPLIVGWSHYPMSRGRVTGVMKSANGFAPLIFNLITTALVNPNHQVAMITEQNGQVTNHYFDHEVADRTPFMIRCLAGIYLLLSVVGILCMGNSTKDSNPDIAEDRITLSEGLHSGKFWKLCIASYLSFSFPVYVAAAYKTFGNERVHSDYFLATVGAVASVLNGSFRLLWAELVERLGCKTTYISLLIGQVLVSVSIYYIATTNITYMIYICLSFLSEGGHFVIFPSVCAKFYGKNTGASLYALVLVGFGLSSITGFIIQKLFIGAIGYEYMFLILTAAGLLALWIASTIEEASPFRKNSNLAEALLEGKTPDTMTNH